MWDEPRKACSSQADRQLVGLEGSPTTDQCLLTDARCDVVYSTQTMGPRALFRVNKQQASQLFRFISRIDIK